MSRFAGARHVTPTGSGNWMQPGNYRVELKRMECRKSTDPLKNGAEMIICEFKVLASSNPAHAVNTTGAWLAKFDQFNKTLANLNALFAAALDGWFKANEIKPTSPEALEIVELCEQALLEGHTDDGVAAAKELASLGIADVSAHILGKVVDLECSQITTRQKQPFTVYSWSAAE